MAVYVYEGAGDVIYIYIRAWGGRGGKESVNHTNMFLGVGGGGPCYRACWFQSSEDFKGLFLPYVHIPIHRNIY